MAEVKIKLDKHGFGSITVDGQKIPRTRSVQLVGDVGEPPRVEIEVIATSVEVEAETDSVNFDKTVIDVTSYSDTEDQYLEVPRCEP